MQIAGPIDVHLVCLHLFCCDLALLFFVLNYIASFHFEEKKQPGRRVCGKQNKQSKDFPWRDEEITQPGQLWPDYRGPAELQDDGQLGSSTVKDIGLNWRCEYSQSVQRYVRIEWRPRLKDKDYHHLICGCFLMCPLSLRHVPVCPPTSQEAVPWEVPAADWPWLWIWA